VYWIRITRQRGGKVDRQLISYVFLFRDGGTIVKHVYAFSSQRVKDNWLRTLRFAGTKLGKCLFSVCYIHCVSIIQLDHSSR